MCILCNTQLIFIWICYKMQEPEFYSNEILGYKLGTKTATSLNLHNALANCIWCGDRHSGSNSAGLATMINTAFALDTATFNLFKLYKNSIPLGASSCVDVAMEKIITAASCP